MTGDARLFLTGISAAAAVAVAMLVWSLLHIGVTAIAHYRRSFTDQARFRLRELFLFIEPRHLFMLNLGAMSGAAVLGWMAGGSSAFGVAAAGLVATLPRAVLRFLRQRRLNALEQQLPDALLMLAGSMKAGASLSLAVHQLGSELRPPISQEIDLLQREQRLGASLDLALENLSKRVPLQSVMLSVSAIRIASETGGQLAETLERTAQTLRSKRALEQKILALTSQGKLQALVVGALPVFLVLVLTQMEPQAMGLMFTTRIGWATLACIVVLEVLGLVVIRNIVRIDV
ncbi:MAG TPA: type II secretion system F family protein [Albitalea sp.]|uniref:type II secretion system F family protein n=1 Tax=Piscinibacter sp. TaxID=1903157 RepID=UPI002ED64CB4